MKMIAAYHPTPDLKYRPKIVIDKGLNVYHDYILNDSYDNPDDAKKSAAGTIRFIHELEITVLVGRGYKKV